MSFADYTQALRDRGNYRLATEVVTGTAPPKTELGKVYGDQFRFSVARFRQTLPPCNTVVSGLQGNVNVFQGGTPTIQSMTQ